MRRLSSLLCALLAVTSSMAASATSLVPSPSPLATVVEYRNAALGHYFMTAEPAEVANIDAGGVGPNWRRTGYAWSAFVSPGAGRVPVCRFFGHQPGGPNSHFYTANPAECAAVRLRPEWDYEGIAFYTIPFHPVAGCPAGTYVVDRAYNNGEGGDPNHRYTNRPAVFAGMAAVGWYPEGAVMCSPTPPFTVDEMLATCPTTAEVDALRSRLTITVAHDAGAPALVCTEAQGSRNLTHVQERVYQALKAMTLIRFTEPLPWTAQPTLFDWMVTEAGIHGMVIDDTGVSYCCDAGGIIHVVVGPTSVVLATSRWVDLAQGYGLLDLVDLITHESRHNQGKPHTCASVPGNDQTLSELGAWGAVHALYTWLAQAADPAFVDQPSAGTTNAVYPSYRSYYLARAQATLARICDPSG